MEWTPPPVVEEGQEGGWTSPPPVEVGQEEWTPPPAVEEEVATAKKPSATTARVFPSAPSVMASPIAQGPKTNSIASLSLTQR